MVIHRTIEIQASDLYFRSSVWNEQAASKSRRSHPRLRAGDKCDFSNILLGCSAGMTHMCISRT